MPADDLAPYVTRASAGMVLTVQDRALVLLFMSQFHLLDSGQIQDTIQNMNIFVVIFETIQHVKS